jgi:hypothetical protein
MDRNFFAKLSTYRQQSGGTSIHQGGDGMAAIRRLKKF